ncbi:MAG: sigma-54 dependent transcriptional regulator [Candidatus Aminicenantes bacterium]|nr:sigma-54 dependent transcriptional regulator [Candidatus Aminicenantes bacterium]
MKSDIKARIMIVDDEENIRKSLRMILEYEGYTVVEASSGEDALDMLAVQEMPDLILLDIMLPGKDGLSILQDLRRKPFAPDVIMISGQATVKAAVEATKLGAFDFMEKPLSRDQVLLRIRNALTQNRLLRECQDLKRKAEKRYEIIGSHPLIQGLWKEVQKIAPTNATVLIFGESGTGKELIARAIHNLSLRTKEPFVQVNCAAIPEELIESELFGHERGAFTGATEKKSGKFEQADGGTIFLDEIGDMSLKTQSKVLRVLEEGEVQKVGSSRTNKVEVRVITATNKDLHEEIGRGRFREDLFFRLNVVPLVSPPLRERKEDIQILAEYFCRTYADENNARPKRFAEDALEAMMKYPWKGNVRELRNLVERLIIMTDGEVIRRRDLPETVSGERSVLLPDAKAVKTLREYRDLAEKDFILAKLEANGWNISQTAREIDTPRSNLYKKLEQYGIKITAGVGEAAAPSSEEEGE